MLSSNEPAETAKPKPMKQMIHRAMRMTEGRDLAVAFLVKPVDGEPERYVVEMNGEEVWSQVNDHQTTYDEYGHKRPNPTGQAASGIAEGLAIAADLVHLVRRLDAVKFELFRLNASHCDDTKQYLDFILFLNGKVTDAEQAVANRKARREYEERQRQAEEERRRYEEEKAAAIAAEEERKRKEAEEYEASRPPAIC
jgi:hypothetical protein